MSLTKKHYNLPAIYASLDEMLIRAQDEFEDTIEAYGKALDINAEDVANYERAKADVIRRLKKEGNAITLISDIAKGEIADIKEVMLKSEAQVKRLKILCDAYIERIQGIKFIGKKGDFAVEGK